MKLAPCQCSRYPDSPCGWTADAEDLLCWHCRRGCELLEHHAETGRSVHAHLESAIFRTPVQPIEFR